jgi:hypothetical protein
MLDIHVTHLDYPKQPDKTIDCNIAIAAIFDYIQIFEKLTKHSAVQQYLNLTVSHGTLPTVKHLIKNRGCYVTLNDILSSSENHDIDVTYFLIDKFEFDDPSFTHLINFAFSTDNQSIFLKLASRTELFSPQWLDKAVRSRSIKIAFVLHESGVRCKDPETLFLFDASKLTQHSENVCLLLDCGYRIPNHQMLFEIAMVIESLFVHFLRSPWHQREILLWSTRDLDRFNVLLRILRIHLR